MSKNYQKLPFPQKLSLQFSLALRWPSAGDRQILDQIWQDYDQISTQYIGYYEIAAFESAQISHNTLSAKLSALFNNIDHPTLPAALGAYAQFNRSLAARYEKNKAPYTAARCRAISDLLTETKIKAGTLSPRISRVMGQAFIKNKNSFLPLSIG